MARPIKEGIDYFPLDVNIDEDDKIALIEAEHGIVGFAVIVKLFMRTYSQHGYYTMMTEREQKLFAKRINVDIMQLNAIIMLALCEHLFDKCMYDAYGILTSKAIQKRYMEIVGRRKNITLCKDYLLIDVPDSVNINLINADINQVNVDMMQHNADSSTQRKEKEIKEKEIKELKDIGNFDVSSDDKLKDKNSPSGYCSYKLNDGKELTIEQYIVALNIPAYKDSIVKIKKDGEK